MGADPVLYRCRRWNEPQHSYRERRSHFDGFRTVRFRLSSNLDRTFTNPDRLASQRLAFDEWRTVIRLTSKGWRPKINGQEFEDECDLAVTR